MESKKNNLRPIPNLSSTIHLLGNLLGFVISELESVEVFEIEEQIRFDSKARRSGNKDAGDKLKNSVSSFTPLTARAIASAFTIYFDLVNLAEENDRVGNILLEEQKYYPDPVPESIDEAIALIKEKGISKEKMEKFIENLSIEIVLTAHPTEAKRRTILSKLQSLAEILFILKHSDLEPSKVNEYISDMHSRIAAIWLTDRTRTMRPAVTDEVRTGLYFIDEIFWSLLPEIYDLFDQSLAKFYPDLSMKRIWINLASWIGGDRDGNPNVTTEVTAETLRLHRGLAVEKHRAVLRDLSRSLSISYKRLPPSKEILEWIDNHRPFQPHVTYIEERYKNEPYRLALSLLSADLAKASQDDMRAKLLSDKLQSAYLKTEEIINVFNNIIKTLPSPLVKIQPHRVLRQLQIFGLHAAHLHIREDADNINAALSELLHVLEIENNFHKMDSIERFDLLTNLLQKSPPDLSGYPALSPASSEILSLFKLTIRARLIYGLDLLGPIIISMTKCAADLLAVLLLTQWTGCGECISIVPLFETIANLEAAPQILEELFCNEIYKKHLLKNKNRQTVMIGYSDTNKDGGYFTANWTLYKAQEEIADVCTNHGIVLTIFHGRGGSTARGGGPSNDAIRSQPFGSINGRFCLTEQGEVISSRYSNPYLAKKHIEEIVHAVLLSSFKETSSGKPVIKEWRDEITRMSEVSNKVYRELVFNTEGFKKFWQSATPIDEIKRLRIGSRPTIRGTEEESINSIRAIPWVFSWMQCRFNLPGWFGLGSGLKSCKDFKILKDMYDNWLFFKTLINNTEISLLIADMEIAHMYTTLVQDKDLAKIIYKKIENEFKQTEESILKITGHSALLDSNINLQQSIKLRNPYADPLNYLQVEMLRRLRSLSDPDGSEAEFLREVIVITINGIASGLKNTG